MAERDPCDKPTESKAGYLDFIATSSSDLLASSWSIMSKALTHAVDGSVQVVSRSVASIGSIGNGFLAKTGMTQWLSLRSQSDGKLLVDEKHFFLVPYVLAPQGYVFATIRVLPPDVAPVNSLPKRRYIHLPNGPSRAMLESLVLEQVRSECRKETSESSSSRVNQSMSGIADQLDLIDSQLFYGALAIGTVVALINPVAGAVVAAKALTPSIVATLTKYGLRSVGNSFEASAIESKIRMAEKDVLKQFSGCETREIVNPMLARLALAIRTTEHEFDPVFDSHPSDLVLSDDLTISLVDCKRLTAQAIVNVYSELFENEAFAADCNMGPEDVRWLWNLRKAAESGA